MTTPLFPATLPAASLGSYSYRPGENLIRTEMENGPAKVRRRFVSVPTDVNVSWKFSREELATFEGFFRNTIYDGAAWFQMKLVNGAGETLCTARFKEPYQAEALSRENAWRITATLEVMNLPTI